MPRGKSAEKKLLDVVLPEPQEEDSFSEQLESELRRLADDPLVPSSALKFLTRLIVESATADKTKIEKLKMMDKLLNTARALMETGIRHEETATMLGRLEKLESRLELLQKKRFNRPADQTVLRESSQTLTD